MAGKNSEVGKKVSEEKKLEKIKMSNYEILCIMRGCTPEQRNELIEKIKKSVLLEDLTTKSEVKKLAYPIEKIKTAEYLLLTFRTERKRITKVEEVLKNPLVIRHMTINLDTEKKIKIRNSEKLQGGKKLRRPGFKTGRTPLEKSDKKVFQESRSQLETNN